MPSLLSTQSLPAYVRGTCFLDEVHTHLLEMPTLFEANNWWGTQEVQIAERRYFGMKIYCKMIN